MFSKLLTKPRDKSWTDVYRNVQKLFDRELGILTCPLCSQRMAIHVTEADVAQMELDEIAGLMRLPLNFSELTSNRYRKGATNKQSNVRVRICVGDQLLQCMQYENIVSDAYRLRSFCVFLVGALAYTPPLTLHSCISRCTACGVRINRASCCGTIYEWCAKCQPDESQQCSACGEYFAFPLIHCDSCNSPVCESCMCLCLEEWTSEGEEESAYL